jgi:hypothetical protein
MIEAMKQALEALETCMYPQQKQMQAITSLRQAIAEAEKQEPKCVVIVEVFGKDWRLEYMSLPVGRHKLYAQQYLYTHPQPKREWVGLTDEERRIIINDWQWQEGKPYHLCLSIEAKLKEKNT